MSYGHLSYMERFEIADGRRDGLSLRAIAWRFITSIQLFSGRITRS
jgi:IS30 family transposase